MSAHPVYIHVLGDSLGDQVMRALSAAQRQNSALAHLHVVPPDSKRMRQMAVIPRTVVGSRALLDRVEWGLPC